MEKLAGLGRAPRRRWAVAIVTGAVLAIAGTVTLALPAFANHVGDMSANALFLLATQQEGQLAITGVLASLYPVSTVLLATLALRERLSKVQLVGVGGCTVAIALIASG